MLIHLRKFSFYLCLSWGVSTSIANAAGLNLHGNLLYFSVANSVRDNGVESTTTTSQNLFRGGACYFVEQSWCLGFDLLQSTRTDETETESSVISANSETEVDWSGTGVSVSYIGKPWYLNATYFFDAESESPSRTLVTDMAYMLEAGIYFDVRGFAVGPVLSYIVFNYDKIKTSQGTEKLETELSDSFMLPSLGASLNF
jgi:hypothetical protein